jgi:hypothetical protein
MLHRVRDFRPVFTNRGITHSMDADGDRRVRHIRAGISNTFTGDARVQMKARILTLFAIDLRDVLIDSDLRRHEVANQKSARSRTRYRSSQVGHRRKPGRPADRQPRASGDQVSAAENIRLVRPPVRICRRTEVVLVAIGGNDQLVPRRSPMRENDETHGESIVNRGHRGKTCARMKMLLPLSLAIALGTLSVTAQEKPGDLPSGYWTEAESSAILKKTATIRLAPDLSTLTAGEQAAVRDLLEAGQTIQKVYEDSRNLQSRAALDKLQHLDVRLGQPKATQNLLQLYRINQGAIATTLDNRREPFILVSIPAGGSAVYPADIHREELESFIATTPEARGAILDPRTVVRRMTTPNIDEDMGHLNKFMLLRELHAGDYAWLKTAKDHPDPSLFYAIPYAVAYADDLVYAFRILLRAADKVEASDPEFARYIRNRARDLVSNDYESGDASWVLGHFKHLNAQIGAYETYDDTLLGVKAFHGMSVLIRDDADSDALRKQLGSLQAIEDALPYGNHKRVRDDISIGVYDVIADFGQARTVNTATNLPNDPLFTRRYGRTILIRKNIITNPDVAGARMNSWKAAVADAFASDYTSDGEVKRTTWHEVGHYLGPERDKSGKSIDEALQEKADAIEELKSDLIALFALQTMNPPDLKAIQASGIRRTLQAVKPSSSQPYQTMELMQFNWFVDRGVLTPDPKTARLTIHYDRYADAVKAMLAEVLKLQHEGDKSAAAAFIQQWTKWTPDVHEKIATRINEAGVPRFWLIRYAALGE